MEIKWKFFFCKLIVRSFTIIIIFKTDYNQRKFFQFEKNLLKKVFFWMFTTFIYYVGYIVVCPFYRYVLWVLLPLRLLLILKVFFITLAICVPVSRLRFLTALCVRHVIYEHQTNYSDQTRGGDSLMPKPTWHWGGVKWGWELCPHFKTCKLNLICVDVLLDCACYVLGFLSVSVFMFVFGITKVSSWWQRVRTLLLSDTVKTRWFFWTALTRSLASNFSVVRLKSGY